MKYQFSNKYVPSEKTASFIDAYVTKAMGIETINDDNIDEVITFIAEKFENPLSQEKNLTVKEKKLLARAADAVTELSTKAYSK
jgi:hypothetical protein